MSLDDLVRATANFAELNHTEKIKLFGWYLHTSKGLTDFSPSQIRECYDELHLDPPTSINPFLTSLLNKKHKEVLKNRNGFRLEKGVRDKFNDTYASRPTSVRITKLLEDLPSRVPDLAERKFLDETITCFRHGAHRATIVMAWSLAFHHLCNFVFTSPQRLSDFNSRWLIVFPGHHKKTKGIREIVKPEDFGEELKERETLEICSSAGLITSDIFRILAEKLGTRNSAAHPSAIEIDQLQAEEFVDSLVKNVVLKLK